MDISVGRAHCRRFQRWSTTGPPAVNPWSTTGSKTGIGIGIGTETDSVGVDLGSVRKMSWHTAHAVAKLQWTPGQPIAVTLPPTATMAAAAYSLLTQLPFEEEESELEIAEEPEDV